MAPSARNYDPMIPYMAPFIEEAKFQLQEEQELLQFPGAAFRGMGSSSLAEHFASFHKEEESEGFEVF